MSCLRHRCSVSLLNNSARARSLSGDALLLIRCCGSTDCARMEYALFLRENFVTVAAEPTSSACGHRTDCRRTEHPLFLREQLLRDTFNICNMQQIASACNGEPLIDNRSVKSSQGSRRKLRPIHTYSYMCTHTHTYIHTEY